MKRPKKLPRGVFVRDDNYWIRYADQFGKMHRESVGPFLEQAKAAVQKRRSEVREGRFFPEKMKARRATLFAEIARDYLKQAQARNRTWRGTQTHLQAVLPALKDAPMADLTPGRLEAVLSELGSDREWAASEPVQTSTAMSTSAARASEQVG